MQLIIVVALLAITVATGLWRARRGRSYAVRRYEHTYSAIDAAVDRARHTGPIVAGGADGQGHVLNVEPAPRRRTLDLVATGDDSDADAGLGVSSPLAG